MQVPMRKSWKRFSEHRSSSIALHRSIGVHRCLPTFSKTSQLSMETNCKPSQDTKHRCHLKKSILYKRHKSHQGHKIKIKRTENLFVTKGSFLWWANKSSEKFITHTHHTHTHTHTHTSIYTYKHKTRHVKIIK